MATTVARLQATLEADTRSFDTAMARSKAELETVAKSAGGMGSSIDDSSVSMRSFGKDADASSNRLTNFNDSVQSSTLHMSQFSRTSDVTKGRVRELGKEVEQGASHLVHFERESKSARVHLSGLQGEIFKVNQGFKLFGNAVKLIKVPGMIAGIGLLIEEINALGAGVYGLVAALAPLTGALVAYPAILAAVGQGLGVVKFAFKDLGKALGGNKKALAALTPAGKELVQTLKDLHPQVVDLRKAAQAGLFPGVEEGLKSALKNFGVLKPIVAATGKELGNLAAAAGHLVGSKGFGKDLTSIGTSNVKVINNLGTGAISLADALRHLLVAAEPFTQWLSKTINLGLQWVDAQTKAGESSGKLAGFLRETHSIMVILGHTLGDLFTGLYNIGKIAAPLGVSLLKEFADLTEKFKEWTESAKGKNAIAAYFKQAKPALDETFKLIGALGGAFLSINQSSTLAPLLKQIRTQLVPVLKNLFQNTAQALGPALINTLTQLATLFGKLAGTSGPLTTFVKAVGKFADILIYLLDHVPGLSQFVILWFGFSSVLKALNFTFVITGLKSMVAFMWSLVPATYTETAALWAMYAAETAVEVGLAILTAPITLVVAALIGLGIAFYEAYTRIKVFHDAVDATFNWIKDHWPLLLIALTGPIGVAVGEIIQHWDTVKKATFGAVDYVKTTIVNGWEWIKTKTVAAWNAIRDDVLNPIKNGIVNYFLNWTLPGMILSHWNTIESDVKRVWGGIMKFLNGIPGDIAAVFTNAWPTVKKAVKGLFESIVNWIYDFLGIKSPSTVFHSIGANMIQGFIDGVGSKAGALRRKVIEIVKSAPAAIGQEAGRAFAPVTGGVSTPSNVPKGFTLAGEDLVPGDNVVSQVANAVEWAHTHGWHGHVTSGFRTYAQQADLYAKYKAGGPLAAKPGTSSHERGEAVDVSDPSQFGAVMARAPGWARLYNRLGSADPVHFSVSGYDKGGWLPPGATLAVNQTGRSERVISGNEGNLVMPINIGGERLVTLVWDQLRQKMVVYENLNGRPAF